MLPDIKICLLVGGWGNDNHTTNEILSKITCFSNSKKIIRNNLKIN